MVQSTQVLVLSATTSSRARNIKRIAVDGLFRVSSGSKAFTLRTLTFHPGTKYVGQTYYDFSAADAAFPAGVLRHPNSTISIHSSIWSRVRFVNSILNLILSRLTSFRSVFFWQWSTAHLRLLMRINAVFLDVNRA